MRQKWIWIGVGLGLSYLALLSIALWMIVTPSVYEHLRYLDDIAIWMFGPLRPLWSVLDPFIPSWWQIALVVPYALLLGLIFSAICHFTTALLCSRLNVHGAVATIIGVGFAAGISFFAFNFFAGYVPPSSRCGTDKAEEFLSPDGTRKAVMYRVNCGALSDWSWQICILPANSPLPRWRRPVFITDGDLTVVPRWIDSLHLTVVYGPGRDGGDAARRVTSFGPVKIAYHYIP